MTIYIVSGDDVVAFYPLTNCLAGSDTKGGNTGTVTGVNFMTGPNGEAGGAAGFDGTTNSYIKIPKVHTPHLLSLVMHLYIGM